LELKATNSSGQATDDCIWYVGDNSISQFEFPNFNPTRPNSAGGQNLWTNAINGGNAFIHRLAPTAAGFTPGGHKRGTIVFSINAKISKTSAASVERPTFNIFWRDSVAGGDWQALSLTTETSPEYNQNNWPPGVGGDQSGLYDPELYPSGVGGGDLSCWFNYVRAFERLDFPDNVQGDIEYAIVAKGFTVVTNPNGVEGAVWVQSDDLHYAKCIPRVIAGFPDDLGSNAAQKDQTDPYNYGDPTLFHTFYEYNRSEGTNVYEVDENNFSQPLYAETPYTEYVYKFWNDQDLIDVFKPVSLEQTINFGWKEDVDNNGTGFWNDLDGDNNNNHVILRCCAAFDFETGEKIAGIYAGTLYVSARQATYGTTGDFPFTTFGITRFRFDD
jgi:hypothetical protein